MAERSPSSGPAIRPAVCCQPWLARCGAAVVGVLIVASAVCAQGVSTRMTVSVTIVRSCTVNSSALGPVTLVCSNGVSRVAVAAGDRSSIRALVGGTNALAVDASQRPLSVTLNF